MSSFYQNTRDAYECLVKASALLREAQRELETGTVPIRKRDQVNRALAHIRAEITLTSSKFLSYVEIPKDKTLRDGC